MKRSFPLAILLPIILSLTAAAQTFPPTSRHEDGLHRHPLRVYALSGGQVIRSPGKDPEPVTIVIRDEKIVAIGAKVDIPVEAEVIDLGGKFVYPGLIDSYAEVSFDQANSRPPTSYWNENIRADFDVRSVLTSKELAAGDLRKQGFVARLIAPQDGIVKGRSAIYALGQDDLSQLVLRDQFALAGELTLGRRRSRGNYPNSPMGAVALARQAFYDAQWYRDAHRAAHADAMLPLPERNVTLDAMQPYVDGRLPVMIETSNDQFLLRADEFAREFGLDMIAIGSGREYRQLDAIAKTKRTIIVPIDFAKAPNVATPQAADDATLQALMHWDHAPENIARLLDRKVEVLLTTHRLESPSLFLKNLRIAVHRGLNEADALAAMTTVPAKRFGIDKQLGTIDEGKLASLVVTSKPLFDDKAEVVETWVNGHRYEHHDDLPHGLASDWKISIQDPPEKTDQVLLINVSGDKTLKGTIRPAETTPKFKDKIELKSIKFEDGQITAQFVADNFGIKGVATLSIVYQEDVETRYGSLRWPDGSVTPVTMVPSGMQAEDKEEPKETESKDTEKSGETKKEDEDKPKRLRMASFPVQYPLGAYGREKPVKQESLVAITGATIWTSGPLGKIDKGTILINNGKIEKIGKKISIPKEAVVVDATGKHITPGLIDCHSHIATDGGINESGQAITAEVRIADFVDADDITIYWQLAGGLTTANVLHGSANPIGGQNQVIKMRWGTNYENLKFREAPAGIKFALGENVKQSNWGDDFNTRYPQTRMGVEQVFRDEFREAQQYQKAHQDYAKNKHGLPPRRDLQFDAIVEILNGKRWVHCHSYRQDEILALIRVLDEYDITIGSLQHILEGYKVADAMKEHGATGSTFSDWWAYKVEVRDAIPFNGALMHNQGVVVSFNSDDWEMGRRMNQEAAKAVKYGNLSPEEALKFITINPAIQLRIEKYVGSIEPGKHADLAIWSGPPLSNFSVCEQTWIDGIKYFDRLEEQQRHQQMAEMKNTLVQKILDSRAPMMDEGESLEDGSQLWPRHDEFCHAHDEHEHGHEH
ncbi:N-acetylglucosamine-6-phosphate deacetylase [Blastopirellula marina]|uniref:N-acetylglucosamine-6-phosphate deacetylase n=1 Tax=Blastopirellula marina TaxID=124 RepID=A0A2S8FSV3_9BACT|nr:MULTISPECIES: amidohydrolase family protein [Pirellulaceae]PQO35262.1 N-acetylglucosamine-6-phosphate deacetylase [Blastopirellula marina]RCS53131.1 N-acetylglucosamine-6-phosphate deacetylase [Bremerella cremea]